MMNKFDTLKPYSPVGERDFIWVAEYINGEVYPEFDYQTHNQNLFDAINRQILMRFGYVGHGLKLYYDVATGIFNMAGKEFEFIYKIGRQNYNLTGRYVLYNDIIQYKRSFSNFSPCGGINQNSSTCQYNLGYKVQFDIDGINFHFKPILHIPLGQPSYFTIWMVADKDLDGVLEIRRNKIKCFETDAPLSANSGGELTWIVNL